MLVAPITVPQTRSPLAYEDVQLAATTYRPRTALGVEDARRATDLVKQLLVESPAQLVANKILTEAVHLLETGERFRTAFDYPEALKSTETDTYLARRREVETTYDLHGRGDAAGKTVYASVQLGPRVSDAELGVDRLNTGQLRFGAAAFVLKPELMERATFSHDDSFFVSAGGFGSKGQLPSVILDSMGTERVQELLAGTDTEFIASVRAHMHKLNRDGRYVEAQVRGPVTMADVQEIRIETEPDDFLFRTDDAQVLTKSLRTLVNLAEDRGIPLKLQDAQ